MVGLHCTNSNSYYASGMSRQLTWSQEVPYLTGHLPLVPSAYAETMPFDRRVNTEDLPALPRGTRDLEVRRRDIGRHHYASGTATVPAGSHTPVHKPRGYKRNLSGVEVFSTPIGKIALTNPESRNLGGAPSVATFDFLKHQYQGSRFNPPHQRFFP